MDSIILSKDNIDGITTNGISNYSFEEIPIDKCDSLREKINDMYWDGKLITDQDVYDQIEHMVTKNLINRL